MHSATTAASILISSVLVTYIMSFDERDGSDYATHNTACPYSTDLAFIFIQMIQTVSK